MQKRRPYEHIVTKNLGFIEYFVTNEPKSYVRLKSELNLLKGIKCYYANAENVYVGKNKSSFGLPEIRQRIIQTGNYEEMIYSSKDAKKKPSLPSWAEYTGYVMNLSEWQDAYMYMNKCPILVTEKFNEQTEKYELIKIEALNEQKLTRQKL